MRDIDSFIKDKLKPIPTVKPKGWFTINELIERSGMARHCVRDRLSKGIDNKEIESMEIIQDGRKIKCYREAKK